MRHHSVVGLVLVLLSAVACAAQTQAAGAQAEGKPKPDPEALRKYAGRYELEVGLIPVSTLDVTLEGGELFVKPSLVRKRKLIRKSKNVFRDEVEGARYRFQTDDEGQVVGLTFPYEGAEYTAARVRLPPPSTSGNTTFRLKGHPGAQVVALAGAFNNWNQSQFLFGREGDEWVCRIDLEPGRYGYKFIVDGNWLLDPSNPETEEDAAGNINNVLEVKPR
ncbi:MAG TPA: DUF3471 domain-containing protein [Pyrinomonadaceae bacterium]